MNEIQWSEPKPLRIGAGALMQFPIGALPPVLRNMVQAISVTTSTDVGMAGTAMLSSVGYCFTGLYRLAGKPDHTEPPVLYSLIIAQPSERKSPVMHFIKAPFTSFEIKYNEDHKQEMYQAQQEKKALLLKVTAMEKAKEPDPAAIAKLRIQADNIRGDNPIRIAVDDITPESLAVELSANGTLLMISDEAGMLTNFNGKYSNVPNLDLLLKAWNGEQYINDRATKGRSKIDRPYLSVTLAGQPYIWDNMVADNIFRSSGLLARFILCFAKSNIGNRRYDTASVPPAFKESYHALIHQLLKGKFSCKGEEQILQLSQSASKLYVEYCNTYIEKSLTKEMSCCQDWGGKMHGLILRIALILHCVDCCSQGIEPSDMNVSETTLINANALALYYQEQAMFGFGMNAPDGQIIKAEKIVQMFRAKEIRQGVKSELYRACRCNLFKDAEDFYKTLGTLEDYGYIAFEEIRVGNNKPVQMVHVNPHL